MRLHRFFINNNAEKAELSSNQKLGASKISILNPEIIHQLSKVFRYKIGQKVILFNGTGLDYVYEISKLSKDSAEFIFVEKKANKNLRANFTVAFSIIKKQNNELIIQKCTELGVSDFQPLISERTEKKNFEIDRVTKIAIEAVEQSGQDTIPTINNPMHLSDFLEQLSIINA
ncbi:MAG TPA: RsmE family RNA methyltransferase, partial [Candidatus Paceibacterota bacterium]|nr:RsmE family RNA methyltransferase [Candidatus Paceibacterota bacterium]